MLPLSEQNWRQGMAAAYRAGFQDGVQNTPGHRREPGGFDACYWQGVGHGAGACKCPSHLNNRGPREACPCCAKRRVY